MACPQGSAKSLMQCIRHIHSFVVFSSMNAGGTKVGLDLAGEEALFHQADRGQGVEKHQNNAWAEEQIHGREVP